MKLYIVLHISLSTIVEEITKTSNDSFFGPCQDIFHGPCQDIFCDFPYGDGKMRGPCGPHSANTIFGSFNANFCLVMRFWC